LRAVLIKTAETGIPPANPEAIFERENPKTSLFLSKGFFVIFSASFAEIIVSSIAIIAIVKEVTKRGFTILITSLSDFNSSQ